MTEEERVVAASEMFCGSGKLASAERYGSGHIHDTYSVRFNQCEREPHILLQRMNTAIFRNPVAVLENIELVTLHLRKQVDGTPDARRRVLQLVETRDGNSWHVDGEESYWRAYRFIEGARTIDTVADRNQAFEAAKAFGSFQRMLAEVPVSQLAHVIPGFHDTPKRFAAFEWSVNQDVAKRCREARTEIDFAESHRAIAGLLSASGLPERVTHNDTKLNNVMLDEQTGEGICVIDLDTVMPGLAAYDFGDMVRTMTCSAAEDERDLASVGMSFPLFEAVLRGYLEGAGGFLRAEERQSLIAGAKVIVFEQAIRFLTDFLGGDTYYKASRPGQNLDRCRTQFQLLESIGKQEMEMQALLESLS